MPNLFTSLAAFFLLVQPIDDALVDRFVASFPDQEVLSQQGTFSAVRERWRRLNPSRSQQVEEAVGEYAQCLQPMLRPILMRTFRRVAEAMGRDRVEKMIAFYGSPDFQAFNGLREKFERREAPSPAEERFVAGLFERYPLVDFARHMQTALPQMTEDAEFRTATERCGPVIAAAARRHGLRVTE